MTDQRDSRDLDELLSLVRRLRGPDGCPWDQEQTLQSVRAHILEEAHEVAAAIDDENVEDLADELGDLLFQVCFVAELAREKTSISMSSILQRIIDKMVERHPHVFGDEDLGDSQSVSRAWERRKASALPRERSLLDGVPASIPALLGAYRVGQKAAGVGFDWRNADEVRAKAVEELQELDEAISGGDHQEIESEVGDLLFAVASWARHLSVDPERALAGSSLRFRSRFRHIEVSMGDELFLGDANSDAHRERLEESWAQAKELERNSDPAD